MIKWVKFLDSASHTEKVYLTETKSLQESEPSFDFATPEEALAKSTVETVIFWDNKLAGIGLKSEPGVDVADQIIATS